MKRSNVIGILAAAAVIVLSVVLISWYLTKRTPTLIQGTVECTTYKASSKVPGRIDDMKVAQGDRVEKGQLLYTLEGCLGLVQGQLGAVVGVGRRVACFFVIFHKRNLRTHNASGFDTDGILYGNGTGNLLDKGNADFHICLLERSVSGAESDINLRLDILCLINQIHHLADQDVTLLVHQFITLTGKFQRVFCKYQVSLGGKGIRIHSITSLLLAYCFVIVFIEDLRIDSVKFFLRKKSQKLPAFIKSLGDASVLRL